MRKVAVLNAVPHPAEHTYTAGSLQFASRHMNIGEDEKDLEILDACGRAIGVVLALAARDPKALKSGPGLLALAGQIGDMCDADRFSPEVTTVLSGVMGALSAVAVMREGDNGEVA